jgi:hypothetical protein
MFVLPNEAVECGVRGSCTDIHFRVLCFNNANGEPIMCSIILKSIKEVNQLPASVKLGIDRSIEIDIENGQSQIEVIENNLNNNVMIGGPSCTYKGKEIPCFVGCSPNSSITSQMLADMLALIDSSGACNCDGGLTSFRLLDGHHSRFGLPFLKYIHDNKNQWTCCIGVPYGTHLWQVADSFHMNGFFKSKLTKAKRDLLSFSTKLHPNFNNPMSFRWCEKRGIPASQKRKKPNPL